jgi:hypothetical protein
MLLTTLTSYQRKSFKTGHNFLFAVRRWSAPHNAAPSNASQRSMRTAPDAHLPLICQSASRAYKYLSSLLTLFGDQGAPALANQSVGQEVERRQTVRLLSTPAITSSTQPSQSSSQPFTLSERRAHTRIVVGPQAQRTSQVLQDSALAAPVDRVALPLPRVSDDQVRNACSFKPALARCLYVLYK